MKISMEKANFLTPACKFCCHYKPEGRRGGACQKLGVPVQSSWKACIFSSSPFTKTWENLEEIIYLEHSLSLDCSEENSSLETTEAKQAI